MIDLHSHILPGVDDGSPDLATSIAMARMAWADGIKAMACTPHFMPGLYNNKAEDIRTRVAALSAEFTKHGIELILVTGGDIHVRPDFVQALQSKQVLSLNESRYALLEPPHLILPLRLEDLIFNIVSAGYVPIITHPERLGWIDQHYAVLTRMAAAGAWMQITAGSLTGRFGKRAQYWGQRMLQDGLVHVLASDAHNVGSRPPLLSQALALAAREVGSVEAQKLVFDRPLAVLHNEVFSVPQVARQRHVANWKRG